MDDHLKPRRPRPEEQAEIEEKISWAQIEVKDPSLHVLIRERKEDEEAAYQRSEENETVWEQEESERIRRAEAKMNIDIPIRRERELMKTFPSEIFIRQQETETRPRRENESPYSPPYP
jgi:hypothetical protein